MQEVLQARLMKLETVLRFLATDDSFSAWYRLSKSTISCFSSNVLDMIYQASENFIKVIYSITFYI